MLYKLKFIIYSIMQKKVYYCILLLHVVVFFRRSLNYVIEIHELKF